MKVLQGALFSRYYLTDVLGLKSESPIQVKRNDMSLNVNVIIVLLIAMVVVMIAITWSIQTFKVLEFNRKLQNNLNSPLILKLKTNSSDKHGTLMHSCEPQSNGHVEK
jgi:hypothetical protein